jgi:hypothetical protein
MSSEDHLPAMECPQLLMPLHAAVLEGLTAAAGEACTTTIARNVNWFVCCGLKS